MDLIKIENGTVLLDEQTSANIAAFERAIKSIKEQEDELKAAILAEMESKGIIKIDTDEIQITYIAQTDRETFDSKSFRAVDPETYDKYVKISPVKASVRIKVK